MDKEFLSELLLGTRIAGIQGISIEVLYIITELSEFIKNKDEDIKVKEYIALLDNINKELKCGDNKVLDK